MTQDDFRQIALSFPETTESAHMNHPDFRVRGKIFATLHYPDTQWGMVKLPPEQQEVFVKANPEAFVRVKGAWGLQGATSVRLKTVKKTVLRHALAVAWQDTAEKKAVKKTRKAV
jgi:hypothetical protein